MAKQKKEVAALAINGHSSGSTPAGTPSQTPSQSSEESASDSEKETVRLFFFYVFSEDTNLNFVLIIYAYN